MINRSRVVRTSLLAAVAALASLPSSAFAQEADAAPAQAVAPTLGEPTKAATPATDGQSADSQEQTPKPVIVEVEADEATAPSQTEAPSSTDASQTTPATDREQSEAGHTAAAEERLDDPFAPRGASDAELERYLSDNNLQADGGSGPSLQLYGFADFTYGQYLIPSDSPWRLLYNSQGSFAVGNLNVYFDAQLHETVRTLAEVRFTYLPYGNVTALGPPSQRNTLKSSDYTRNERDVVVGGVRIERAWLEWAPHQLAQIKFGQWLTPYGIWNVDHGTPVIIPVTRPFMIDEQLLPESQTGILLEGRVDIADDYALDYGLGISNGRGPIDVYFDFDSNRAVTGRAKMTYSGFGELAVGASAYVGQYTYAETNLTIVNAQLQSFDDILTQYDEFSVAADLRWTLGGFLFQSEFMLNERSYSEDGRPSGAAPSSLAPDEQRWGIYGLTGYRFKWLGVMPYILAEFSPVPTTSVSELPREVVLMGGGLNIRPIAQVVVKLGYDHAFFPENRPTTFDEHPINRLQGQVAWAF